MPASRPEPHQSVRQVRGRAVAHGDFTGLNLVSEGQHSDLTLELRHAVPNCSSKPLYKQIARGRSVAAFQGKIIVERDAQKTDAKLMMQGLMLSDEAQILSKPELEIFADDVVCGHGSTVGSARRGLAVLSDEPRYPES